MSETKESENGKDDVIKNGNDVTNGNEVIKNGNDITNRSSAWLNASYSEKNATALRPILSDSMDPPHHIHTKN